MPLMDFMVGQLELNREDIQASIAYASQVDIMDDVTIAIHKFDLSLLFGQIYIIHIIGYYY